MYKLDELIEKKKDFREFFNEHKGQIYYDKNFGEVQFRFDTIESCDSIKFYAINGDYVFRIILRDNSDSDYLWRAFIIGGMFWMEYKPVLDKDAEFGKFLGKLWARLEKND